MQMSDDEPRPAASILSGPTRVLLPLALAVIVIFGMKYASSILNPIFFALFLTMGVSPALYWLRRRGVPAWLCMVIIMVVTVVLVLLFVLVMLSAVNQLDDKLPAYQEHLGNLTGSVQDWFAAHDIHIGSLTAKTLSPGNVLSAARTLLTSLSGIFGNLFWLLLIFIFMLAEAYAIPARIGDMHLNKRFAHSFVNFVDVTKTFLFTKGWLSAIMAVICSLIYWGFGVDFALVWGILFFLLSFVPNIGFILSVVPPFFVCLLEFGITRAIVVVVVVIVANSMVDNVVAPRIMSRSVGLSSLTIFLSLFFWSWVLGGLGALMSVPLTLMVKLLFLDSFDSARVLSEIMATPVRDIGKRRRRGKAKDETAAATVE
jgi:AI-2 transport protein TqsA